MRYSSEEPSKKIPHQEPSLNHSLLWVFAAVGPAGQSWGLTGLCSPKAMPVSKKIKPTPPITSVKGLYRRVMEIIETLAVPGYLLDAMFRSECNKVPNAGNQVQQHGPRDVHYCTFSVPK